MVATMLAGFFVPTTAVAQFSSQNVQQIESLMETTAAPELDFPNGCAVSEYLALITSSLKGHSIFPLPIVPDAAELELENVNSLGDVLLPPLQMNYGAMTVMDQIDLVFGMTDDPELTVVPQNGILLVTTTARAEELLETRTYPALELLNLNGLPPVGPERTRQLQAALQSLVDVTSEQASAGFRATWMNIDGEGGSIHVVNSMLVVSQTNQAHKQIRKILNSIRNPGSFHSSSQATLAKEQLTHPNEIDSTQDMLQTLRVLAIIGWLVAIAFAVCSLILLSKLAAGMKAAK